MHNLAGAVTTLIGELENQASLAAVLYLVYSLGLALLTVTCLGWPQRKQLLREAG